MPHNMSAYQKFIDSASKSESSNGSNGSNNTPHTHQRSPQSSSLIVVNNTCKSQSNNMIRHQILNHNINHTKMNLPISVLDSFASTPISKQQYKRLVEAEHQVIIGQNQNQNQNQRQQHTDRRCSATSCQHQFQHHQQHCALDQCRRVNSPTAVDSCIKTDDPVLMKWLQAMRFETALECLTYMQARTLTIDEHSANALSVRNSQVAVQEMKAESNFILDFIDYLIGALPLRSNKITKFFIEFSELWTRLMNQTSARTAANQNQVNSTTLNSNNKQNNLTIFNCTPRKSQAVVRAQRPLDELAVKIRNLCIEYANLLYHYQERATENIDNDYLESSLRKLKELYGNFIEISIRFECANIVRALNYDFSQASLNRLSSSSSLLPARPFESSSSQLPLKWALIALWQLTNGDSDICRTLTERWQTMEPAMEGSHSPPSTRVAKRLDYSTKYDNHAQVAPATRQDDQCSIRSEYQKLYQICPNSENFKNYHDISARNSGRSSANAGALSSALKNKQLPVRQMSTIEMLIDIIISQPNKHERLDMTNLIHHQAQNGKLIDLDEWDESVTAAIYTSNQYKVAALRILNHLCVNEQAVKTILKCFSTPPPSQGQPIPENKIIRSIFECFQTSQEHIYQNETMFHTTRYGAQRGRKRSRQVQQLEDEEYSDYGSRNTNTASHLTDENDEGDDAVVKEAISLLVRLTNSFQQRKGLDFYTLIGRFSIDSLVRHLTSIIRASSSREMILLSLNAIANISFITTEPMKLSGTNRVMLEMFRANKNRAKDLELRDQAVTILTNTVDKNLLDIVINGGLTFLLSCLESCPIRMASYKQTTRKDALEAEDEFQKLNIENKPRDRKPIDFREDFADVLDCSCDQQQSNSPILSVDMSSQCYSSTLHLPSNQCLSRLSPVEQAAIERIHQKAAIAFGRMSVDAVTTQMVLKYGGVKQMIDLCKFSTKRNHSETVLRACIETLRKIADIIGNEAFKHYNALDLIELEQKKALEIYGSFKTRPSATSKLYVSDV